MRRESTKRRTQAVPEGSVEEGMAGGPEVAMKALVAQVLRQKGSATMTPSLREVMALLQLWRTLPEGSPREVELEWREEEE